MRWILPLLIVLGLGWLATCCVYHHARSIESDISARAAQLTAQYPWARVSVDGRDVTAHGTPPTQTAAQIVLDQLGILRGARAVHSNWAEPGAQAKGRPGLRLQPSSTLTLTASLTKAGVTLSGTVPSENDSSALQRYLARHRRDVAVEAQLDIDAAASSAQSAQFRQATATGIRGLMRLVDGRLQVDEHQITLSGVTRSPLAQRQLEADMRRNLPQGYVFRSLLGAAATTRTAPARKQAPLTEVQQAVVTACQAGFDALMRNSSIAFGNNSDALDGSSNALLDRIAVQANACQNTRILVAGHSDKTGDAAYNVDLSQRRAEAVRQALIARNIAPARLQARGFGATQPRATNNTAAGRAANRRIEFMLSYAANEDTP